ncbi:MAG: hypothetical protein K6A98_04295 [Prevotella sp.]|jgi:hypothetical protein|nr:hypothetical protein [Prevotella sp.]MCR5152357.1 hypothetical protein [Prevotella sp.]
MNNKRILKKVINGACAEMFAEALAFSLYSGNVDEENAKSLLASIVKTNDDFIRRVSHPEPGMKPKVYYKILWEDFQKSFNELIDYINNIG